MAVKSTVCSLEPWLVKANKEMIKREIINQCVSWGYFPRPLKEAILKKLSLDKRDLDSTAQCQVYHSQKSQLREQWLSSFMY